MGRELQLGWPGRVLEPVGLAQGGLATDPGGDGMKSGTSQNTSPGFGAFLAFPPPMAACPCVGDETCRRHRQRNGDLTECQYQSSARGQRETGSSFIAINLGQELMGGCSLCDRACSD
ncbi:hypothetical protein L3Q82_010683 [Scortum barcoo]|uniref:Uncharacterized protein n=1 Tax=Scortum barcoo TaxID=214431 RepID=A0ACB8WC37_9TELE|nr:hypothetical protein L3Q82_010683 [Scortum barcoo]